jgi:hypothetical protein
MLSPRHGDDEPRKRRLDGDDMPRIKATMVHVLEEEIAEPYVSRLSLPLQRMPSQIGDKTIKCLIWGTAKLNQTFAGPEERAHENHEVFPN